MNDILKRFYDQGFSIIPVRQDKRPLIPWEGYMHRRADWVTIQGWANVYPQCAWAAVCGGVSGGLTVLDCDDPRLAGLLNIDTLTVRTPSGGLHIYVKSVKIPEKELAYRGYALDIQGERSYTLIPPSKTEKGDYIIIKDVPIKEYKNVISYIDGRLQPISEQRGREIDRFKQSVGTGIIESWVSKKSVGHNYWTGLCPFHPDKEPSFTVYDDGYYCFGCQSQGDIIDFVMKVEDINFKAALNRLSQISGVSIPEIDKGTIDMENTIAPAPPKSPLPRLQDIKLHLQPDNYVGKYLDYATKANDAYYEYHFAIALMHLSIAVDRLLYIKMVQQTIYPNLWIFCLGDSTISRKTAAAGFGECMGHAVFGQEMFLPQAGSPAALIEILSDTPKGVIWRDEAGQLLKEMGKEYMAEIKDLYCKIYDNQGLHRKLRSSQRKNVVTEFNVKDPYVTMYLATVPDVFKEYTSILDVTSGWLVRFLYFTPDYAKGYMPFRPESEEDIKAWSNALAHLRTTYLKVQANPGEVKLHPDALALFQKWQEISERRLMEKRDKIEMAIFGRLVTYCLKLSLLLTISENPEAREIPVHIIEDAIALIDGYFKPVAVNLIEEIGLDERNNLQDKIMGVIKRAGGKITQRQLLKRLHKPLRDVDDAINALKASGEIVKIDGGNQQVIYKLNISDTDDIGTAISNDQVYQGVPGVPPVQGVPDDKIINGTPVDTLKSNVIDAGVTKQDINGTPVPPGTPGTPISTVITPTHCGICGTSIYNNAESVGLGLGKIHPECKFNPVLIKFLKDIPVFVGIDYVKYGSFCCGDIASVPAMNAYALINRHSAELIEPYIHVRRHTTDSCISVVNVAEVKGIIATNATGW